VYNTLRYRTRRDKCYAAGEIQRRRDEAKRRRRRRRLLHQIFRDSPTRRDNANFFVPLIDSH